MRKDTLFGADVKGYFITYRLKGVNADGLVNALKRRNLSVYDYKKIDGKRFYLTLKSEERQKFFAIAEEMCYTDIAEVKKSGRLYPLACLLRNFGLIIGALIFALAAVYADGFILEYSFVGSGSVYYREAEEYLSSHGAKIRSRFSALDLDELSDGLLASSNRFSFAECSKKGNVLYVRLASASQAPERLSGVATELKSDVDGIIEKIKVYRGRALFSEGDSVKKGDVLVDGLISDGETTLDVNVIASATLLTKTDFVYRSRNDDEEDRAVVFALASLEYDESLEESVTKSFDGTAYVYKVRVTTRRTVFAG